MYTIPFPTAVVPFRGGHPDSTIAPLLLSRTRTSSDNPGFNPDPADGRSDSAEAGGVLQPRAGAGSGPTDTISGISPCATASEKPW